MHGKWIGCFALVALGVVCGCGGSEGAAPYEPEPECVVTDVEIARDEATELGFSADEMLAPIEGTFESVLEYRDGGNTDLVITVAHDGSPIVLRESVAPADEPNKQCPAKGVHARVRVTFDTADGAFNESWAKDVSASTAGDTDTSLLGDIATEDLQGTWEPGEWTGVSFVVQLAEEGGATGTSGELTSKLEGGESGATECGFAFWNRPGPVTGCAE